MKAVILEQRGAQGIRVGEFPDPVRAHGQAVMRVREAKIDQMQAQQEIDQAATMAGAVAKLAPVLQEQQGAA